MKRDPFSSRRSTLRPSMALPRWMLRRRDELARDLARDRTLTLAEAVARLSSAGFGNVPAGTISEQELRR